MKLTLRVPKDLLKPHRNDLVMLLRLGAGVNAFETTVRLLVQVGGGGSGTAQLSRVHSGVSGSQRVQDDISRCSIDCQHAHSSGRRRRHLVSWLRAGAGRGRRSSSRRRCPRRDCRVCRSRRARRAARSGGFVSSWEFTLLYVGLGDKDRATRDRILRLGTEPGRTGRSLCREPRSKERDGGTGVQRAARRPLCRLQRCDESCLSQGLRNATARRARRSATAGRPSAC
jgi:hypothetical protein